MTDFLSWFKELEPVMMMLIIFLIAYSEHIFPPAPSDFLLASISAIATYLQISSSYILIFSSVGSLSGFITMYFAGKLFGKNIIERGRIKFINRDLLKKIEKWFSIYGYWVVFFNRFLPGTRSVVSFFSGVHKLKMEKVIILGSLSILAWNLFLILIGKIIGANFDKIEKLLSLYSEIMIIFVLVVGILFISFQYFKKNNEKFGS